MVWECDKGYIEPVQAGAQRKIDCATSSATCFLANKKRLVFKRENDFCQWHENPCLRGTDQGQVDGARVVLHGMIVPPYSCTVTICTDNVADIE